MIPRQKYLHLNGHTILAWKLCSGIVIAFSLVSVVSSLKCYHCLERPRSAERHLSCAYFDMSEKFHRECNSSSFCMKKTSYFHLHNGTQITIYVHKCADQLHRTMVQDKNGDWNWANLLRHDLYNEGCSRHNNPSVLTTEASHCFCKSDFCNFSSLLLPAKFVIFSSTLFSLILSTVSEFRITFDVT